MPMKTDGNNGHGNVIAFSGAQGTGKTTAAKMWAGRLEKENPRKSVGLVLDIERKCPYPINRETTHQAQEWIFFHQLSDEIHAAVEHDIVVTDRTVMDVIAYSMAAGFYAQVDEMLGLWRRHEHYYRKIIFRNTVTNWWNVEDGCRDTDPVFRARIEATLYELYRYAAVTTQERFSEV